MDPKIIKPHQSVFPKWDQLVGHNLDKMAKNCMKIIKSQFLGQNSGEDMEWQANFLGIGGRSLPRGNPANAFWKDLMIY